MPRGGPEPGPPPGPLALTLHAHKLRELTLDGSRAAGGGRYVSAAGGLVRAGGRMYVAADDERELAVFPRRAAPGRLVPFLPESCRPDPEERKRDKPDVEALALLPGGALLALESGSKPNRRGGVLWDLDAGGALTGDPRRLDLAPLYAVLEADIPDLNIEGATVAGDRLLLFQRGNGRAGINAAIGLDLASARIEMRDGGLSPAVLIDIDRHDLGEVDGVRLCFSDATAVGDAGVLFWPSPNPARTPTATGCAPAPPSGCCAPTEARLDQAARPAGEGGGHRGPRCGHRAGSADGRGSRRSRHGRAAARRAPLAVVRRRQTRRRPRTGPPSLVSFLRPVHHGIVASVIAL